MSVPISVSEQKQFINSIHTQGHYIKAVNESVEIVGIQDVLPSEDDGSVGLISTFIRMDCLRQGVGSSLTQHTITLLKESHFTMIRAIIRKVNQGAIHFYKNMGFVHTNYSESSEKEQVILEFNL